MKLTTEDLLKLKNLAIEAAAGAAKHIQDNSGKITEVRHKEGMKSKASAVVTEIDLQCQELILEKLSGSIKEYDLGLLTEELADDGSRLEKDFFWCIDPLDGTLAFTEQRPGYAVSIALVSKEGKPIIGIVHDPITGEVYDAIGDTGYHLPKPIGEDKQVLCCHFDNSIKYHPKRDLIFSELQKSVEKLGLDELQIHYGKGAVLNACHVAKSKYGLYFKFPKKEKGGGCIWDFAATACLFEEMGLIATDVSGRKLNLNNYNSTFFNHCGVLFATDEKLQTVVLKLFEKFSG